MEMNFWKKYIFLCAVGFARDVSPVSTGLLHSKIISRLNPVKWIGYSAGGEAARNTAHVVQ